MRLLGISAFYHDSAAALVVDGQVIAAAEEERLSRSRHDTAFPHKAIAACLAAAGCTLSELDGVVFYEKPVRKFDRLMQTAMAFAPQGVALFSAAAMTWLREKGFLRPLLLRRLRKFHPQFDSAKLFFCDNHIAQAAGAFYPSPFEEAAVLVVDGVGEWATTTLAAGRGNKLEVIEQLKYPHSLGLLYSAFTSYLGFKVNSGEYKLMGLAPYGTPRYAALITDHLIDVKDDGSFHLDMSYFNFGMALGMTSPRFAALFGQPPRQPEQLIAPFHMDVAASIQQVLNDIMIKLAEHAAAKTGLKNLCLTGDVATNSVANGKVQRAMVFDNVWIQPAAGDAAGSLGAALAAYHLMHHLPRNVQQPDGMKGAYLAPSYGPADIEGRLTKLGAKFTVLDDKTLFDKTAATIADGKLIGWFQGGGEFGPRALGNRSILADPRGMTMQQTLNRKIKAREAYRPFAAAVLVEDMRSWFDVNRPSPYLNMTVPVQPDKRAAVPAITHVDGSARLQTVSAETNPRFHALISAFKNLTGCPLLVNTSFNARGAPVAQAPEDAYACFMASAIDVLVIGNCWVVKS